MVAMRVGVDEMRYGYVGSVTNGVEEVVAEGWGTVDNNHALGRDEEEGLVASVEDDIGAPAEGLDEVAGTGDNRANSSGGERGILWDVIGADEVAAVVGEYGGKEG